MWMLELELVAKHHGVRTGFQSLAQSVQPLLGQSVRFSPQASSHRQARPEPIRAPDPAGLPVVLQPARAVWRLEAGR